jgi:hypothetical protein
MDAMGQQWDIEAAGRTTVEGSAGADFLLYDGECPACAAYVAMSRLRQLYPGLRIWSARTEPALVARLRAEGYEIDEGMALSLGCVVHFGAEATRTIAVLGRVSPSCRRRVALACIGTAPWARRLYSLLARARAPAAPARAETHRLTVESTPAETLSHSHKVGQDAKTRRFHVIAGLVPAIQPTTCSGALPWVGSRQHRPSPVQASAAMTVEKVAPGGGPSNPCLPLQVV